MGAMDGGPLQPAYLYELGSADPELARLAAISRLYGPMTGGWLDAAGIRPGMRVADLGCGPGDVTRAAAQRGGPPGAGAGEGAAGGGGGGRGGPGGRVGRAGARAQGAAPRSVASRGGGVPGGGPAEPV